MLPSLRGRFRAVVLVAGALGFASLLVLLALPARDTAIPPRLGILAVIAVALAAGASSGSARLRPARDLGLALLAALGASHLLFFGGVPFGHDTITHLWGIRGICQGLRAGEAFPRWIHELGLGTPFLVFYGSGPYVATMAPGLAGCSPAVSLAFAFVLFACVGAVAMQALVARWTGDGRAGLVAAVAYAFAPYRLLDTSYRGALAEAAALAVLPLVVGSFEAAARWPVPRRVATAALAWGTLAACHAPSAIVAALTLPAALAAYTSVARPTGRQLGAGTLGLAAATALGLALSAFHLLPLAAELPFVGFGDRKATSYSAQAVRPAQLLDRRPWTELLLAEPRGTSADAAGHEMPPYFGWMLLALGAVALAPRQLIAPSLARDSLAAALGAGGVLALALASHPLAGVAEAILPPLRSIFFPWRFLTAATFCGAALAGVAAARLIATTHGRYVAPGLILLFVADGAPYTGAAAWLPTTRELSSVAGVTTPIGGRKGLWRATPLTGAPPLRVAGFFVPPTDPTADVGFASCLREFANRTVAEGLLSRLDPSTLAAVGTEWVAYPDGRVERLAGARSYAIWVDPGGERPVPFQRGGGEIRLNVAAFASRGSGFVVVLEQAFPGWRVQVAENGWEDARATPQGLLTAPVEAGAQIVRFRFTEWRPDRAVGWALSAVALALCAAMLARRPTSRFRRPVDSANGTPTVAY